VRFLQRDDGGQVRAAVVALAAPESDRDRHGPAGAGAPWPTTLLLLGGRLPDPRPVAAG
jgi:hypothetical protein